MTQEDKDLLLKDLCARLSYGVKCYGYQFKIDGNHCEVYGTLTGIKDGYHYLSDRVSVNDGKTYDERYLEVKPYLRPMSSMTEEEENEYAFLLNDGGWGVSEALITNIIDWLNSHHFDYRNLIEKNLALDCTGLHIYDSDVIDDFRSELEKI